MKLRKSALVLGLLTFSLGLLAQTERVGVNTRTPTEELDVQGSVRIQTLPKTGEGVTTNTSGSYDAGKSTNFAPNKVVVTNDQGVLGVMNAAWPLFFYMPSVLLPVETTDPSYNSGTSTFTIDLYKLYTDQFNPAGSGIPSPPAVQSAGATGLPVVAKTDLEYYVTYYDKAVFTSVGLTNQGVLTYKLVSAAPDVTEKTFMNVVFKRKL